MSVLSVSCFGGIPAGWRACSYRYENYRTYEALNTESIDPFGIPSYRRYWKAVSRKRDLLWKMDEINCYLSLRELLLVPAGKSCWRTAYFLRGSGWKGFWDRGDVGFVLFLDCCFPFGLVARRMEVEGLTMVTRTAAWINEINCDVTSSHW